MVGVGEVETDESALTAPQSEMVKWRVSSVYLLTALCGSSSEEGRNLYPLTPLIIAHCLTEGKCLGIMDKHVKRQEKKPKKGRMNADTRDAQHSDNPPYRTAATPSRCKQSFSVWIKLFIYLFHVFP